MDRSVLDAIDSAINSHHDGELDGWELVLIGSRAESLCKRHAELMQIAEGMAVALKMAWSENYVNGIAAREKSEQALRKYNDWKDKQ